MNILLVGASGFIGTNLTIQLAKNKNNNILLVDSNRSFFDVIDNMNFPNVIIEEAAFDLDTNFDILTRNQDVVYHLATTTLPAISNQQIPQELIANVVVTSKLLEACVRNKVHMVVFISSGGTVYGKEVACPLKENTPTNPISSYGVQKVTIEKLLYLYQYAYGLDYRIVRLANPYGPYQRPNGILGAVTTFTYKALMNEQITVYGDGSAIRDFIYIDDAVRAIINIANSENNHRTFNLGSGYGTSINEVLDSIQTVLNLKPNIVYKQGRKVDVPINYLDISRYEEAYGALRPIPLNEGIWRTAEFMRSFYKMIY